MGATFVIALREGIEASLIVSILLAYLRKVGRPEGSRLVWVGTASAGALSAVVAIGIFLAGASFDGRAAQIFEGSATLAAVAVLSWMIFWMRRQSATLRTELQEKVDGALLAGGSALAAIAFFAVLREGVETALFLFAAASGTAVAQGAVTAQMLLGKLYPGHPHHLAALVFRLSRTVQWWREAAGLDAGPPRRQIEEVALTTLFVATVTCWAADRSPDQKATRAFLGRSLVAADTLAGRLFAVLQASAASSRR